MNHYAQDILNLIVNSHNHPTAEEIYQALLSQTPHPSLATVYNQLNAMTARGQIRKVAVEGYPDRYDRIQPHDHLVCQKCGKLSDISLRDLTASLQEQLSVQILSYDLKVHYLCPDCQDQPTNH